MVVFHDECTELDRAEKKARKAAAERARNATDPERIKYVAQREQEREQKRKERQHILQEIENDKLERRKIVATPTTRHTEETVPSETSSKVKPLTGTTHISIRQPNSQILKSDFSPSANLTTLRNYIDSHRTDSSPRPYVLQTTFPTRTFQVAEEESLTLGEVFGKGGQCVMKVLPYEQIGGRQ
jgi:UBX domain